MADQKQTSIDPSLFTPLEAKEKHSELLVRKSRTYWQEAWLHFSKDPLAMIGLIFIGLLIILAVFGPMVSPYTYDGQDFSVRNQLPSFKHPFGTDKMGRDIFTRILYGARISLTVGFVAAAISVTIGILYGGAAGYFGGKTDMLLMRIVDLLSGLPSLLYIILIMMYLGNKLTSILIALCVTSWIETARLVRSQILSLKHEDYVLAARSMGAPDRRIFLKHLVPNSMGIILVSVTFLVPNAIFAEAFLSFLGIGIQVPVASWGTLANEAIPTLFTQPYQMIFPAAIISLTMFALNFIGDGLRDALDPRMK